MLDLMMATYDEALEKIGEGISMNAFCYAFGQESSVLLDRLLRANKVIIARSKKHKITVIMPKTNKS